MQSARWPLLDHRVPVRLRPPESSVVWPILDIVVALSVLILVPAGLAYLTTAGLSVLATSLTRPPG